MNTLAEENYLKAIFALMDENGEVMVNELSQRLAIKMPTVSSMMKKLANKNLVTYESYKPIRLTEKGRVEAALIIRKHRLTEMYLVEKMGFGWEEVHHIAEQIEHIQSPELFAKMDELLGFPALDPHGSPIPDCSGKMIPREYQKLSHCKAGEKVKITAVVNTSHEFLTFLNGKQIHLGLEIGIEAFEQFDQSMTIIYNNKKETVSSAVTERILVERVK
jgi:DtxR family Mn-dependent transcriptional regulator